MANAPHNASQGPGHTSPHSRDAVIAVMNTYMAAYHPQITAFTPLQPNTSYSPHVYAQNYTLFSGLVLQDVNAHNHDQSFWNIFSDSSSDFREALNAALPGESMDLADEGDALFTTSTPKPAFTPHSQNILEALSKAPPPTLSTLFNHNPLHNAPSPQHLATAVRLLHSSGPVPASYLSAQPAPTSAQPSQTTQLSPFDPDLDNTLTPQLREIVSAIQYDLNLTLNGQLDQETQDMIFQTLNTRAKLSSTKKLGALDSTLPAQLQAHLKKEISALREQEVAQKQSDNEALQRTHLKDAGLPDTTHDAIIDALKRHTTFPLAYPQVKPLLQQHFPDSASCKDFAMTLFALELQSLSLQRNKAALDVRSKIAPNIDVLLLINDLFENRLQPNGAPPIISRDILAGSEKDKPLYDKDYFFSDADYEAHGPEREAVAAQALDKLYARMQNNGMNDTTELTQALFDGRMNIAFQDLELAYEGLGRPSLEEILNDPIMRTHLGIKLHSNLIQLDTLNTQLSIENQLDTLDTNQALREELAYKLKSLPDYLLCPMLDIHRTRAFNATFGSLSDVVYTQDPLSSDANTPFLTGQHAILQHQITYWGSRFVSHYGISPEGAQDALNAGEPLPHRLQDYLNENLHSEKPGLSAFQYFDINRSHYEANRTAYVLTHQMKMSPEDAQNTITNMNGAVQAPEEETGIPGSPEVNNGLPISSPAQSHHP